MKAAIRNIRVQDVLLVLVLMFFGIAGAVPGIAPKQANEMTGASAGQVAVVVGIGLQVFVNGCIAVWLLRDMRALWARRAAAAPVVSLGLLAVLSVAWSADRGMTARRAVPFLLAGLFGVWMVVQVGHERCMRLLRLALVVLALWSALLALGFPAIGLDASTGHLTDWQGAFSQKNACGRAMVFGLAAVLCAERWTVLRIAQGGLFLLVLGMSGSRGAWVVAACAVGMWGLSALFNRLGRWERFAFFVMSVIGGLGLFGSAAGWYPYATMLLGRDATLTGRTDIWSAVWAAIRSHMALGYGFSGFWHGAAGASWNTTVALRFVVFHAHNGLLEIWLELGAVGVVLFLGTLLRAAWLLLPELMHDRSRQALWPWMVLLLIVLYDIDENTLLAFNGLFWVLYASSLACAEMVVRDRRLVQETHARNIGDSAPGILSDQAKVPLWL